jgi:hypothetical protein
MNVNQQGVNTTRDKIGSWQKFSHPSYKNPYADRQREMLDRILNREDFSYDKGNDPVWQSYKKSYLREGDRAQSNALARASQMTGGRPSSFATTAASQAGDYYASRLNDMIPQLYGQAYDRYLNEYSMKHQDLGAVNNQQQIDYRRFLDNRGFAFDVHNNWFNQNMQKHNMYRGLEDTDWQRWWAQQQASRSRGGGAAGTPNAGDNDFGKILEGIFGNSGGARVNQQDFRSPWNFFHSAEQPRATPHWQWWQNQRANNPSWGRITPGYVPTGGTNWHRNI